VAYQPRSSVPVPGHIYVLRPKGTLNGQEVVKIGMTTRTVAERVRELQTGSMVGIELAYSIRVEDARGLERQLHRQYNSRRLVGGGTEFFQVPAREVIAEIERFATAVSKHRAQSARDIELKRFCREIGAAQFQGRIDWLFIFLFVACWTGSIWLASHLSHNKDIVGTAGLGTPFALRFAFSHMKKIIRLRAYEPRFGADIARKHVELRARFPLAYS